MELQEKLFVKVYSKESIRLNHMFNIYINYIILSLKFDDIQKRVQYYILSTDKYLLLPNIKLLNGQNLLEAREQCLSQYTNLKLSWLDDQLLDIEQIENNIHIYYMCRIPIETEINNGQFIPIHTKELLSPYIQKAIRYA